MKRKSGHGGRPIFGRSFPAILDILYHTGRYFQLLAEVFSKPERFAIYWKRTVEEVDLLGVKSLGIVALLSVFMGAVITIQTKTNIDSPLIQVWVVGFATRQSTICDKSHQRLECVCLSTALVRTKAAINHAPSNRYTIFHDEGWFMRSWCKLSFL